ncbi:GNAT family N-acetyltransferase [Streptomyces sp. NPDC041003]|uniref:GNAT family N-acetyltransferase n=1 Tax=Streptomyces sp. NPDC041003 TaxID=3155730 RepID=UPI0033C866AC
MFGEDRHSVLAGVESDDVRAVAVKDQLVRHWDGQEADHALGELYALYVQPSLIGTGVGRTLLNAVNTHAAARGFGTLLLWVFRNTLRARRFYELAGYSADGAVQVDEYEG